MEFFFYSTCWGHMEGCHQCE